MPRKRVVRSPPSEKRSDDDDDFFYEDSLSGSGRSSQEPQHRNAANARERARMRVLSKAFCRLKTTLPWVPADTKLSKLDTLRLAASYIAHLRAILHDEPRTASEMFPHPLNLAWPFAFQHGGTITPPRWNSTPSQPHELPTHQCEELPTHQCEELPTLHEGNYRYHDYEERNYKENHQYSDNEYFYKDAVEYETRNCLNHSVND